jgi:hypothetical protein
MTNLLPLTAILAVVGLAPAPPGKFTFVNLQPQVNQKLTDNFGSGRDGNDLVAVGKDGRTFGGANFKLADGVIQLGSPVLGSPKPSKVEGIKVDHTCAKIHIVQSTIYGNGQGVGIEGKEGEPGFVADGKTIAEYKVHYEDGTTATIPVVYGQDVRDWWFTEASKDATRAKMVWKGENELTRELGCRLRLFMTTWDNPHPEKKIATIDYAKTGDSPAAPFCLAITLEAK